MKILVTGGAGFIGSHVTDAYVERGHRVWVLDDESSGDRRRVNKKATFVRGSVNNKKLVTSLFKRVRFNVVKRGPSRATVRW